MRTYTPSFQEFVDALNTRLDNDEARNGSERFAEVLVEELGE